MAMNKRDTLPAPRGGARRLGGGLLLMALAAGAMGCSASEDHFRRAQELIAAIERDNVGGKPDYRDGRYDDVLRELSSVPASDRSFWKAREWTQKITEARQAAATTAPAPVETARPGPKPGKGLPQELTSTDLGSPKSEPVDPLEWHEHQGGADVTLVNLKVKVEPSGVSGRAWVQNTSGRPMRIKARFTALGADGAELASSESVSTGASVATGDRTELSLLIGAYDPATATEAPPEPPAAMAGGSAPPIVPFDPKSAVKFRLEFMTLDGGPLSWIDERVGRIKPAA